jgi:hypothetical protein
VSRGRAKDRRAWLRNSRAVLVSGRNSRQFGLLTTNAISLRELLVAPQEFFDATRA